MNYQITSDNIEISESMKELVYLKMQKLERRWESVHEGSKSVRVVLNSAPDKTFMVKIEATINGEPYFTEEAGFELETALVDAVEELDRIYRKDKDYDQKQQWQQAREEKTVSEDDLEV